MSKNTVFFVKNTLFIICLVVVAVSWRIVNNSYNIAPNLELITTASVLAALIIGLRAALIVPIVTMVISDIIIGNTSIFMFTWGAFAIIGLSATLLRKLSQKPKAQILYSIGFAAASSFMFFLITNFGVWAQGWYPATLAGLADSYIMAIPFYRTMLIGNLILVPTSIAIWQTIKYRQVTKQLVIDTFIRD